jgi:8-oxo-dGTP pyrophosphatase MutT (NUDIX family)
MGHVGHVVKSGHQVRAIKSGFTFHAKPLKIITMEAVLRDAATLILLKQNAGIQQVLLGRRGAGHRFMPNVLVFPGGAVDPADFSACAATPLRLEVQARLERSASPELARALAFAAARELTEETGLSLGAPPALGALDYFCRAETPPEHEIRFNARFFLADANHASGVPTSSHEMEDLFWHDLAAAAPSTISLPTRVVLDLLKRQLADNSLANASRRVPVLRHRIWQSE